jgi:hypothetical protein
MAKSARQPLSWRTATFMQLRATRNAAQDYYQRALAVYRAYGYLQAVVDTLLHLAGTLRDQRLLFEAKATAEEAIDLSEKYRVNLDGPELRSAYLDAQL